MPSEREFREIAVAEEEIVLFVKMLEVLAVVEVEMPYKVPVIELFIHVLLSALERLIAAVAV